MEIGDAFRSRIEGRIGETIEKYFDGGFSGHVTVEKSGPRFSADCVIFLDTGMGLRVVSLARRLQAHARRLAMTLGRALELALLVEHGDVAAACRFAAAPVDLLVDINSEDSARLIE